MIRAANPTEAAIVHESVRPSTLGERIHRLARELDTASIATIATERDPEQLTRLPRP
jgi:hypothetical protein